MYEKERIPIQVKRAVWDRFCHPSDNNYAQCWVCGFLCRRPQSLVKYGDLINWLDSTLPAEFGHRIAEKQGGATNVDNLVIECKSCNVKHGTDPIPSRYPDVHMYNSTNGSFPKEAFAQLPEYMVVETESTGIKCSAWINHANRSCNNKVLQGCNFCTIHKN
jgi:hypothetical protein